MKPHSESSYDDANDLKENSAKKIKMFCLPPRVADDLKVEDLPERLQKMILDSESEQVEKYHLR